MKCHLKKCREDDKSRLDQGTSLISRRVLFATKKESSAADVRLHLDWDAIIQHKCICQKQDSIKCILQPTKEVIKKLKNVISVHMFGWIICHIYFAVQLSQSAYTYTLKYIFEIINHLSQLNSISDTTVSTTISFQLLLATTVLLFF